MQRRVVAVLDRTLGDGAGLRNDLLPTEERGALIPGRSFGNRGPGGPPAWMWRAENGDAAWEVGTPPVRCGEWYNE